MNITFDIAFVSPVLGRRRAAINWLRAAWRKVLIAVRACGLSTGAVATLRPMRWLALVVYTLCQMSTLAMGMSLADEFASIPTLHSRTAVFRWLHPAQPAPLASLRALDGTTIDLMQLRGKVVLVHFWATWCVLCIYELPALDRLAAHRSGDRFTVVAVSMDEDAPRTVPSFIARNHLVHLPVYLDPSQDFASAFPRYGIPMTYLIDSVGDIIGFVEGTVQWDTSEAQRFIDYFLAAP